MDTPYDLKDLALPLTEGPVLALLDALTSTGATRSAVMPLLHANAGIAEFRKRYWDQSPFPSSFDVPRPQDGPRPGSSEAALAEANAGLTEGYRTGASTPLDVAARVLGALEKDRETLRAFVFWDRQDLEAQARQSAARWAQGRPLGPLDGVPVAVKDELDQVGFPTKVGTSFLGTQAADRDAETVARLRAAGALLVGKTTMHEIGIGVTGQNIHHGTPRNPLDPSRHTGGSSAGSGAAVGSGLVPLALGADGGGSIRLPAAFCGVVGLKATFGRISEAGAAPLCWSVAHVGPLGASVAATALGYSVIAGPDPRDPGTLGQPPVVLPDLAGASLKGRVLGIDEAWFTHADPEVVRICRQRVDTMVARGATVVLLALRDLEAYRVAHGITIIAEMALAMEPHWKDHRKDFSPEVRINLELARSLTASDLLKARQVRNAALDQFQEVLRRVDCIVTPAAAVLPPVRRPSADRRGNWDVTTLTKIMRYVTPANLTGLPALVFPAGRPPSGLSVGLQLIGRAWDEAGLLETAEAASRP